MKFYISLMISAAFICLPFLSTAQNSDIAVPPTTDWLLKLNQNKSISMISYTMDNHPILQRDGKLVLPSQTRQTSKKTRQILRVKGRHDSDTTEVIINLPCSSLSEAQARGVLKTTPHRPNSECKDKT